MRPPAWRWTQAESLKEALAGLPVGMIVSPGFYIQMQR